MSISRASALRLFSAPMAASLAPLVPRAAFAQSVPTPLHLVLFPGETSATAYYALELGLFRAANLAVDIIEVTNGAAGAAAVAGGSADIGFSNPLSIAQGFERGLPFTVLSPAALSVAGRPATNGMIVVAKTSPIKSARDMNGKIFSIDVLGGLPYVSVRTWIDKNGGDSSTVKFVELPFSAMTQAVISGRVDVSEMNVAYDPQIGKPDDPLHLIGNSYEAVGPRYCSSLWFATNDWVSKNPDAARRFVAVMKQAAVWANAHPHESAVMLAPHIKQTVAAIESSTRVLYGVDMTPDLIQPVIDASAKYGLLKSRFSATELVNAIALAK
jgi:NitT/TauT family transport system substrate-binding protein